MLAATAFLAVGCDDDNDNNGGGASAPAQITNVTFTPQPGGGYFLYTYPDDENFLYTRAEYIIDSGEKISKTTSCYLDTLFIEGFGSVKEYQVKIYSVGRNNATSEPVIMNVTPLPTATETILNTVQIKSGFSSIIAEWENETEAKITAYITISIDGREATKVQSSNLKKDQFSIENLEGRSYKVTARLEDNYGNSSSVRDLGEITPKEDYELEKDKWSFLRDALLYGNKWDKSEKDETKQKPYAEYQDTWTYDSLRNAAASYFEGRVEKLFNGETDNADLLNLDYCHTGPLSFPFSYFFDLGETVQASRVRVWQRDYGGQFWGGQNCQTFELYISDDADATDGITGWEYVGRYTITKPSDNTLANLAAREGHEFLLYPDDPRFTKPFRYFRYKMCVPFVSSETSICTSEITLYGNTGGNQPYAPSVTPEATTPTE